MADVKQQEALNLCNQKRRSLGLQNLVWDADLAHRAQEWANTVAKANAAGHDPTLDKTRVNGKGIGENVFGGSGAMRNEYMEATKSWLKEEKVYKSTPAWTQGGPTPRNWFQYGHFAQCVSRDTTRVGMGTAKSASGWTYVVANYEDYGQWFWTKEHNIQ